MTALANVRPIASPSDRPFHHPAQAALTVTVKIDAGDSRAAHSLAGRISEALRTALEANAGVTPDVIVHAPRGRERHVSLRIDVSSRTVWWRGAALRLTRLEFELLLYLSRHADRVCTRQDLMTEVWKTTGPSHTRTLDVHIRRLRNKVGDGNQLITTIRGVGYRLDPACGLAVDEQRRPDWHRGFGHTAQ